MNNKYQKDLEDLQLLTTRLSKLLEEPEPGLFSWHLCVGNVINDISELHKNFLNKSCRSGYNET